MVLLKVDRASMYHSLEVRVPLLDREVIEIASRVDWRSCLDPNRNIGKLPLRHSMGRHVQSQSRSKRGFEVPMSAWLRGPLQQILQEALLERTDLAGLPINKDAFRLMLHQHVTGEADFARSLWTLLSLALWEEKYSVMRLRRHGSSPHPEVRTLAC
jgi:asparagine synthase (glutamine-hydrolysing)